MKKLFALLFVFMLACAASVAGLAEETTQIVDAGGTVYYDVNGNKLTNATSLGGDAVVEMSKTIEQYVPNGGDPVENEFLVTLQVRTTQEIDEISGDTPDAALMLTLDVSNSMIECAVCGEDEDDGDHSGYICYYCDSTKKTVYKRGAESAGNYCEHCGKLFGEHIKTPIDTHRGDHVYVSRLFELKAAAKDFVTEYAHDTGVTTDENGVKDKRMVAIVSFGSNAVRQLNWVDVATENGMRNAIRTIEDLKVANGGNNSSGGTNIEGGLMLSKNLINFGTDTDGVAIDAYDHLYTILMTDGFPTYHVNSSNENTSSITGTSGESGDRVERDDAQDVGKEASAIRNLGSKLYSICFGEDVWKDKPFDNWKDTNPATTQDTTVEDWLKAFSSAAYLAGTEENLFESFSNVLHQIQIATQAFIVEDWMGPYVVYDRSVPVSSGDGSLNNTIREPNPEDYEVGKPTPEFVWDILRSDYDPSISSLKQNPENADELVGTFGFTYQYIAKLDNLNTAYTGGQTFSNNKATLKYAVKENGVWNPDILTGEFPKPEVKGLYGDLTFTKVDQDGNAIDGVTFTLTTNETALTPGAQTWGTKTATSNKGVVTFEDLPSGHEYRLQETPLDGYYETGMSRVEINWGKAEPLPNSPLTTAPDNSLVLVNRQIEDGNGDITIKKKFGEGNSFEPVSVQFQIAGGDDYFHEFTLEEDNAWQTYIQDLPPGTYTVAEVGTTGIEDGHYSIATEVAGTSGEVTVTDNIAQFTIEKTGGDQKIEVTFTNTYTHRVGSLKVNKLFYDNYGNSVNGDGTAMAQLAANAQLTIELILTPVDATHEPKTYTIPVTYSDGSWSGISENIPIGDYKVTETISGEIPGYDFDYGLFTQGGVQLTNNVITIHEGSANVDLAISNNYELHEGQIKVYKEFDGDIADGEAYERFSTDPIMVDLYRNSVLPENYVRTLYLSGDGWVTMTEPLPVGKYVIVENEDSAEVSGFDLDISYCTYDDKGNKVVKNTGEIDLAHEAIVSIFVSNKYAADYQQLTLTKVNNAGTALKDAQFMLVHNGECENCTADIVQQSATSGENGQFTFSNLIPGHTYKLYEVSPPPADNDASHGYQTIDPLTVKVTDQGATVEGVTDEKIVNQAADYEVRDFDFYKHSSFTGAGIAGAQFKLAHAKDCANCTAVIADMTATSGTDGHVHFGNVAVGHKYVLTETRPPVDHAVQEDGTYDVEVTNEGAIWIDGYPVAMVWIVENDLAHTPATLKFTKVSSYQNLPLPGAQFTLKHHCSTNCASVISDQVATANQDGVVTFSNLLANHQYQLTETVTPAHHEPAPTLNVSVAAAGGTTTVTVTDAHGNEVPLNNGTLVNQTTYTPATLTFTKTSDFPGGPLAGVEFSLVHTGVCENCPFTLDTVKVTTDSTGVVTFEGLPAGHTYRLEESRTAAEYAPIDDMIVTVSSGDQVGDPARVTVKDTEGKTIELNGSTVENTHLKWPTVSLSFNKISYYTKNPLRGAVFTLSHNCDAATCTEVIADQAVMSGIGGLVEFSHIPVKHTYELEETVVPQGYNAAPKMIVEIDADGKITVTGEDDKKIDLNGQILYNYRTDWPTVELNFTKYSSYTQKGLAGVTFNLVHACDSGACADVNVTYNQSVTTVDGGAVLFESIPANHVYTLTETETPEGYVAVGAMTVTVGADETITVTDAQTGEVINLAGKKLYNDLKDWPTKTLTFSKKSSYDQSVIAGAQFDLVHDASCCLTEIAFEPVTSDKYGKVTIANIPQNHTYTLKEIVTPAGYKTMKNMLVEVTEAGDILVDDEPIPSTGLIVYNDLSVIPATITFGAMKTMDGETPEEQYTFILSYEGAEIERVQNVGGEITFSPLLFSAEGKETFTITEEVGDDAKVLYDQSVYTVTVTAKKGADDALELDVSIDKDGNTYTGDIEFHNETMRELPETGDSSRFGLWLAALAIASLGFAALAKRKAVRG